MLLFVSFLLAVVPAFAGEEVFEGVSPPGPLHLRFQDAALVLEARLEDGNGNQALDAGESAWVVFGLTNQGPGKAYQVEVEGRIAGPAPHVDLSQAVSRLGTLGPGERASGRMELRADEDLADGTLVLRIEARDQYGRQARPLELRIETRALVPPDLRLVDVGIDDDDEGDSYGNGNGRIEKGETVEVSAIVQNKGQGEAGAVVVSLAPPEGIFFAGKRRFNLGDLGPGQYRKIGFAFTVPPSYAGGPDLPFGLRIEEARGRFGRKEQIALALNRAEKSGREVAPVQVVVKGRKQGRVEIEQASSLRVDVDEQIPRTGAVNRDGVAVVIGNRNYSRYHPDVPDVAFAARDAAVVREYLVQTLGYQEGNILYQLDARYADFRSLFGTREVEGRVAQLVKPGKSDLFVYYSGHGAPDVEARKGYFVPVDCAPGEVRLNGYPLDLFYQNLGKARARSVAVVIDACFSGGSQQGMLIQAASPVGIRVTNPALNLRNGAVFTSSSGDEISSWYPQKKHGLFTYFFLKGLQGAADQDRDGRITAGELRAFVADPTEGVPYWARRLYQGRRQSPGFYGDERRVIAERGE